MIDWLYRAHIQELVDLDKEIFEEPFTYLDFQAFIGDKYNGKIYRNNSEILGYILYSRQGRFLRIERIGVRSNQQRRGIGTELVDELKSKVAMSTQVTALICEAPQNMLNFHLFLKKNGFKAKINPKRKGLYRFEFIKNKGNKVNIQTTIDD